MPNVNECGVKTVSPMEVQCNVVNPTTPTSSDGSATLVINGGTPPYTILWDNGNIGTSIHNLSGGDYSASVADYYGDFVITTTCVLAQPQPTTTTTTTTTTAQPTYDLCMNITQVNELNTTFTQLHFNPNGLYLGYQSWLSDDSLYKIYWDQSIASWRLSGSTMDIVSQDPSYPPLNGWEYLGGNGSVSVVQGVCQPLPITTFTYTTTNPTCTCDGSIVIEASGVNTPFQYSINGGLNWYNSPVFTNLCGGNYPLVVKDSLGNTYTDSAFIDDIIPTITYTLFQNENYFDNGTTFNLNTTFTINPPLPPGVTVTFDLVLTNNFIRTPYDLSYTNNFNYQLKKLTTIIPENNTTVVNTTEANSVPCEQYLKYKALTTKTWNGLTLSNGQSYDLTSSSVGVSNCGYTPSTPLYELSEENVSVENSIKSEFSLEDYATTYVNCCSTSIYLEYTITNLRIEGCQCCRVNQSYRGVYTRT